MTMPLRPCANCSKPSFMASRSPAPSLQLTPLNLPPFPLQPRASEPVNQVTSHHGGELCLHHEMSLLSTRLPGLSNRESLFKRRKWMVETLTELSASIVA